jgi:hypothetical protein
VGVLAALLHVVPLVTAQLTAPEGWRFTGIHQSSPDLMQYRQWFRQTQLEGPLISNVLTPEPNRPYMLVVFAWAVGVLASWIGATPEFVYAYLGCVLALAFVVVIYRLVEAFVPMPAHRWWIFGAVLVGGGIGGHLKLALRFDAIRDLPGVRRMLWEPFMNWLLFEDYRGQFVFSTFFDTHFLLVWLCSAAGVLLLYRYIERPSGARLTLASALAAFTGVVHLHSGLLIVAIAAGIAWMCWVGRQHAREAVVALAVVGASAMAGVGLQAVFVGIGGLPTSPWQAEPILPSVLFFAYTLQWIVAAWGLTKLWPSPTLGTCVLTGWVIGCLVYTFSGPMWAYPDRGTVTLLIVITIIGGIAYFKERERPSRLAVGIAAFFLLVTPLWTVAHEISVARFSPDLNAKFVSADHDRIVEVARQRAQRGDLLLSDETSLLWLAPEYPGRHYCAHFFLTVDYARKQEDVRKFYAGTAAEQSAFMREHDVKFLFVAARQKPERFADVPGLTLLVENGVGALYSHTP